MATRTSAEVMTLKWRREVRWGDMENPGSRRRQRERKEDTVMLLTGSGWGVGGRTQEGEALLK